MILPRRRWLPEVHAHLCALLEEDHVGAIAAFDFDRTCLTGDIGESLLLALGPEVYAEYERLDREHGHEVSYPWCAAALGDRSLQALERLVIDTSAAVLRSGQVCIRPEIVDLQSAMRARGWDVWIVTASAKRAVLPLAERYGVPADRVLGMTLREQPGWVFPEVIGTVTYRAGKVDALFEATGQAPTFAAGDSITDLELLQSATAGLLLDRGAPHMREHADKEGWWVQPAFQ